MTSKDRYFLTSRVIIHDRRSAKTQGEQKFKSSERMHEAASLWILMIHGNEVLHLSHTR